VRKNNQFIMRRARISQKAITIWLIISLVALVLTIAVLFISTSVKKYDIQSLELHEKKLMQEISVIGSLKKEQKGLEELQKELQYKVRKVEKVGSTKHNTPYYYLKEVAAIIPEQVVLQSFSFDTKGIDLEGVSFNVSSITRFMRKLAQSELFKKPKLVSMNRNEEVADGNVKFVIHVLKR